MVLAHGYVLATYVVLASSLSAIDPALASFCGVTLPMVAISHSSNDWDGSTDALDSDWADRALAHPDEDRGWMQSCDDDTDGRASACEVRELPFHRNGRPVAIQGGSNGGMTIIGWDRDQVRVLYRVKAQAPSTERARQLLHQVELEATRGWIRARGPAQEHDGSWCVEVKAWVPRSTDLMLRSQNGPIGVRAVRGTMDLQTTNGPLSLVELAGAVYARTENGPLNVALGGSRWQGKGLDAESHNGPVNLVVPAGYSARLETGTMNGPTALDRDLAIAGRERGRWSTTLGAGGAPVRVVTENGPFRIAER